jgi:DNA polymerase-3 subunit epsilon
MIHDLAIDLANAWQAALTVKGDLPEQTVVIHGITDDQAAKGSKLKELLPQLLQRLRGKILLVHNAALDRAFLDHACRTLYGAPFIAPIIDTQNLAKRHFERRNLPIKSGELRLFSLRERYNLPRYNAHNALSDALATAELFLAMAAEISPAGDCRLREVMGRWSR